MKRAAWLIVVCALGLPLGAAEWRIVACSAGGRCEVVENKVPADAESAWIWTARTVPVRVAVAELDRAMTRKHEPVAELRLRPSAPLENETRSVIAAPPEMWTEVPEALLPRYECGETAAIPVRPGAATRIRVVSQSRTSLWLDVMPGAHDVPLVALAPREIEVFGADGKPLAGARVSLMRAGSGFDSARVVARQDTDAPGRLVLPNALGTQRAALVVTHADHAPATLTGRIEELPAQVRLARGAELSGRVVRVENGKAVPVAGAAVSLEAWIDGSQALFAKTAATDADGAFRVASIPAGRLSVTVTRAGLATWREEIDLKTSERLDVELQPEAEVAIAVRDDAGAPVAGAAIKTAGKMQRTDEKGVARVRGLAPDRASTINVTAAGMLGAEMTLSAPLPRETEVKLERGVVVRGSCVTADGAPVEGGKATARYGNADQTVALAADGTFEVTVPARQSVALAISSAAHPDHQLTFDSGEPGSAHDAGRIVLTEGTVVRGRVTDAAGAPIALARVWALKAGAEGPIVAWARGRIAETATGEDGSFALNGLDFSAAPTLRVDAPGYARRYIELAPDALNQHDLGDLVLTPGGSIELAAGEDGVAEIDLRGQGLPADVVSVPVAGGRATFRDIAEGRHRVRVRKGRSIACETEVTVAAGEDVRADCASDAMRVTGRVAVGDRAARGGSLVWSRDDATTLPGMILNRFSPGGLKQQQTYGAPSETVVVPVEDDGTFATDSLRPGSWNVTFTAHAGAASRSVAVAVPRQDSFNCVVQYAGGEIRGLVTGPDGQPRGNVTVTDLRDGHRTRTAADGSFHLGGLGAGVARIVAELDDLRSSVVEQEVTENAPVALRLQPRQREAVAIRVLDSTAAPAQGAFVFVEIRGEYPVILTTSAGGTAELRLPAERREQLRVATVARGEWFLGDWTAIDNLGESMTVRVPKGGTILLRGARETDVALTSISGWSVSMMLRRLGAAPVRGDDALRLAGLPPGVYAVDANGASRTVTVAANRVTETDLE